MGMAPRAVGTRVRQAVLLVRPTTRAIRWLPLLAGSAVGFGLLFLARHAPTGSPGRITQVRIAAGALCLGAAFILDDPASETVASSPTPPLYRRAHRIVLALSVIGALWLMLLWYGHAPASPVGLTVELAGMLALTLAAAAIATRILREDLGGVAGGPALLFLLACSALLPSRWALFAAVPSDPRWGASHWRWALLLALGTIGLLHQSLDPGRRGLLAGVVNRLTSPMRQRGVRTGSGRELERGGPR